MLSAHVLGLGSRGGPTVANDESSLVQTARVNGRSRLTGALRLRFLHQDIFPKM